jgi:anaerobic magnesium-protoporphyrin IX monomethyl ester cyclase
MSCDILLLALPLIWGQEYRMDLKPPVNLLYLASYLRKKDLRVSLIDVVSGKQTLHGLLDEIGRLKPRCIGLPFYHASLGTAFEFVRKVRASYPGITVVGGGPSVTIETGRILREGGLDCAIAGEGEVALEEVLKSPKEEWPNLEGVFTMGEGRLRGKARSTFIEDLDSLPFLDYRDISMDVYFAYQQRMKVPRSIFLTTSRGCPHRCVFCATPLLWPGKLRRSSPERIIEEVRFHQARYPGVSAGFLDDSFFSQKEWLHSFLEQIGPLHMHYNCIGRIDHLDRATIEALAGTGCQFVAFGVETGSHERQQKTRKFLDLETLRQNIALFSGLDITTKGFFMLGFPDETIQDMADTINLATELKTRGMKSFSIFPLIIYPGTELAGRFSVTSFESRIYEHYEENLDDMEDFGERRIAMYSTVPTSDANPYLTHEEILELVKLAYNKISKQEFISPAEILALKGRS